jgi:hypothetical protein
VSWEDDWNANDEAERREVYLPTGGDGNKGRPSGWGTWQGPPPGRGCAGSVVTAAAGGVLLAHLVQARQVVR